MPFPYDSNRYFVAIVPPEPLFSELESIKTLLYKTYGLKAALRSPAHITIHRPFLWKKNKINFLFHSFHMFSFHSFQCSLSGFGFFQKNKVLFVRPDLNQDLQNLYTSFVHFSSTHWNLMVEKEHHLPFYPHITLAFRDVSDGVFAILQKEFSAKPFRAHFCVQHLCLLEWQDTKWKVVEKCFFKDVL